MSRVFVGQVIDRLTTTTVFVWDLVAQGRYTAYHIDAMQWPPGTLASCTLNDDETYVTNLAPVDQATIDQYKDKLLLPLR